MRAIAKSLAAACVLAAAALVLGGCGLNWSGYAANVGQSQISPGELESALHGASSDAPFRCLLERSSTSGYRLSGTGTNTYDSAFVAFILTNLIDADVAHRLIESRKLREPASARPLARAQIEDAFASEVASASCGSSGEDLLSGLGRGLAGSFINLQLDEDALAARAVGVTLTPAGLSAYERAHPAATTEACLSGLFLKTPGTATTVKAKLAAGASFASVVAKFSPTQVATGGRLGCYTASSLDSISPQIESDASHARLHVPLGPISYEGSYLVIEVTSHRPEPLVDALDAIFTAHPRSFSTAIRKAVRRSRIVVNPQYGVWTESATASTSLSGFGGHVRPLDGPPLTAVLNLGALRGKVEQASGTTSGS